MTSDISEPRWTRCPPGSLGGIARKARSRRRNAMTREAATMLVLAASVGFTVGYFARTEAPPSAPAGQFHFAGISCGEVHELLPALADDRLDAATATQVRQHVMQCPTCRELMDQMLRGRSVSRASDRIPHTALASSAVRPHVAGDQL
jgi:hypothetical protein